MQLFVWLHLFFQFCLKLESKGEKLTKEHAVILCEVLHSLKKNMTVVWIFMGIEHEYSKYMFIVTNIDICIDTYMNIPK